MSADSAAPLSLNDLRMDATAVLRLELVLGRIERRRARAVSERELAAANDPPVDLPADAPSLAQLTAMQMAPSQRAFDDTEQWLVEVEGMALRAVVPPVLRGLQLTGVAPMQGWHAPAPGWSAYARARGDNARLEIGPGVDGPDEIIFYAELQAPDGDPWVWSYLPPGEAGLVLIRLIQQLAPWQAWPFLRYQRSIGRLTAGLAALDTHVFEVTSALTSRELADLQRASAADTWATDLAAREEELLVVVPERIQATRERIRATIRDLADRLASAQEVPVIIAELDILRRLTWDLSYLPDVDATATRQALASLRDSAEGGGSDADVCACAQAVATELARLI